MSLKDHFREAENTLSISMLDSMKRREAFFLQNNIFLALSMRIFDTAFYYPLKKNKGAVRLFLNFSAVLNALLEMLSKMPGRFPTMATAMMMNSSGN